LSSTPVVVLTIFKTESMMSKTSPVTFDAPIAPSPSETIVIFLASDRGPEIDNKNAFNLVTLIKADKTIRKVGIITVAAREPLLRERVSIIDLLV